MKFGYKAVEARWDEKAAKWRVRLQHMTTGEVIEDSADALISALGALNEWRWPSIEGLHDFKGKLLHSAAWDEGFDYKVSCSIQPWIAADRFLEQESCCHRCWFKWHSDRAQPSARCRAPRPLRSRTNLDSWDLRSGRT